MNLRNPSWKNTVGSILAPISLAVGLTASKPVFADENFTFEYPITVSATVDERGEARVAEYLRHETERVGDDELMGYFFSREVSKNGQVETLGSTSLELFFNPKTGKVEYLRTIDRDVDHNSGLLPLKKETPKARGLESALASAISSAKAPAPATSPVEMAPVAPAGVTAPAEAFSSRPTEAPMTEHEFKQEGYSAPATQPAPVAAPVQPKTERSPAAATHHVPDFDVIGINAVLLRDIVAPSPATSSIAFYSISPTQIAALDKLIRVGWLESRNQQGVENGGFDIGGVYTANGSSFGVDVASQSAARIGAPATDAIAILRKNVQAPIDVNLLAQLGGESAQLVLPVEYKSLEDVLGTYPSVSTDGLGNTFNQLAQTRALKTDLLADALLEINFGDVLLKSAAAYRKEDSDITNDERVVGTLQSGQQIGPFGVSVRTNETRQTYFLMAAPMFLNRLLDVAPVFARTGNSYSFIANELKTASDGQTSFGAMFRKKADSFYGGLTVLADSNSPYSGPEFPSSEKPFDNTFYVSMIGGKAFAVPLALVARASADGLFASNAAMNQSTPRGPSYGANATLLLTREGQQNKVLDAYARAAESEVTRDISNRAADVTHNFDPLEAYVPSQERLMLRVGFQAQGSRGIYTAALAANVLPQLHVGASYVGESNLGDNQTRDDRGMIEAGWMFK